MKPGFSNLLRLTTLALLISSLAGSASASVSSASSRKNHWSPETRALHQKLQRAVGKGTLFGHQNDTWEGSFGWQGHHGGRTDLSDVLAVSGDYPALYGWDLLDISDDLRRHIVAAHERGGVNTISWHMPNPVTGGSYSDTTDALSEILPGRKAHAQFVALLDRAADFLDSLRDRNGRPIPVIFRPFHEHNGYWFWWGLPHGSAKDFAAVFRWSIDYLVNQRQLHSLIIAYSPDATPVTSSFRPFVGYPGDDWVDILGLDMYGDVGRDTLGFIHGPVVREKLRTITSYAQTHGKLAALTETGFEGIPDRKWWTKLFLDTIDASQLSYVMVWRNAHENDKHYYAPKPGHPSVPNFLAMKASGKFLFNQEWADFKVRRRRP